MIRFSTSRIISCSFDALSRQCRLAAPSIKLSQRYVNTESTDCHGMLHRLSLSENGFWHCMAKEQLQWDTDFTVTSDCNINEGHIKWFLGGRLNASVNCIDRHLEKFGDSPALIWEKDEPGTEEYVTYRELHKMVNKVANTLKSHGIGRGDRVVIYLPTCPIAVAAMLACTRIGAIHSVVFAGFSADALADRIIDAEACTVITADEGVRGGKLIPLKKTVDTAVSRCPSIKRVFVYQRTGNKEVSMGKLDINIEQEMASQSDVCMPVSMDSEEYLFMLYTSGSTGKPKGIVHSTAGYLLYAMLTHKHVFDYKAGERFGCVADIGWITGHSYVVYGPLANCGTTVLFESTPLYPDAGRYWEMVERLQLQHIYLAPTSLRMLLKESDDFVTKYDLSSLRKLGCVGEPLNSEAWKWYYELVGKEKCDVVDTWWQTETGGICIAPRPSNPNAKINPAMPMRPFYGIQPALMSAQGEELKGNNQEGALCIKSTWPGMARTIWKDHERFLNTYYRPFPGYYFSGDAASRDAEGHYKITGRMDDVLNVSGHRLGTAEIEDVLDDHPDVAETAVVGFPHDIKGEGIYAFIVLKGHEEHDLKTLVEELQATVKTRISAFAKPDKILFTPGLPKTRSGKIMRRILRKIAADKPDELGDVSTLFDPSVVDILVKKHEKFNKN